MICSGRTCSHKSDETASVGKPSMKRERVASRYDVMDGWNGAKRNHSVPPRS